MATSKMINEALKSATSAQLIRVRALISKHADSNAMMDLNPRAWRCNQALKAFDGGKYDDYYIASVLDDAELGEALR